jgi:hypothetical protein
MRRVREILRLKHECGVTDQGIARSLSVARSTIALTLERVAAGLGWPFPATLADRLLEAMLYAGHVRQQGGRCKAEPYCIDGLVPSAGHTSRDAMRQDVEEGSIRWQGRQGSGQCRNASPGWSHARTALKSIRRP